MTRAVGARLTTAVTGVLAGLALAPGAALAHPGRAPEPHDLATAWTWEPGSVVLLVVTGGLYAMGLRRLWARAGVGRGVSRRAAWAYALGWLVLAVALVSPLHAMGSALFSAHMTQHELLLSGAAPLLVLGRPGVAFAWALPRSWTQGAARVAHATGAWRVWAGVWAVLAAPLAATAVHAAAIWVWHLPGAYSAALRSEAAHALQHASFLGTALLFWWAVLSPRARRRPGAGVVALFLTALYTAVLGALLATADRPWISEYLATTAPWGLMPLEDQQLAGLVMWVPGSVAYAAAALWLLSGRLRAPRRAPVAPAPSTPTVGVRVRFVGGRAAASLGAVVLAGAMTLGTAACADRRAADADARMLTGGDPVRGQAIIRPYGCNTCHTIPGVPGADGLVGPPLTHVAERSYLGGSLPNTPQNLARWIEHPRAVNPHSAMPELGVTDRDARDMAAYLYARR